MHGALSIYLLLSSFRNRVSIWLPVIFWTLHYSLLELGRKSLSPFHDGRFMRINNAHARALKWNSHHIFISALCATDDSYTMFPNRNCQRSTYTTNKCDVCNSTAFIFLFTRVFMSFLAFASVLRATDVFECSKCSKNGENNRIKMNGKADEMRIYCHRWRWRCKRHLQSSLFGCVRHKIDVCRRFKYGFFFLKLTVHKLY